MPHDCRLQKFFAYRRSHVTVERSLQNAGTLHVRKEADVSDDAPQDAADQGVLLSGEDNAAQRLRIEREARGWSTNHLSDLMNEAGFEMNPSAVWRIENGKRRINLDEAIGFAGVFGISLLNFVGPPRLAAKTRALELIDDVVRAFRETQRANAGFTRARDAFDAYIANHPDIREEAEVMISNSMAEIAMETAEAMVPSPPDEGTTPPPDA